MSLSESQAATRSVCGRKSLVNRKLCGNPLDRIFRKYASISLKLLRKTINNLGIWGYRTENWARNCSKSMQGFYIPKGGFGKWNEKSSNVNWMEQRNDNNNNSTKWNKKKCKNVEYGLEEEEGQEKEDGVLYCGSQTLRVFHRHFLWVDDTIAVGTTTNTGTVHSSLSDHCSLSVQIGGVISPKCMLSYVKIYKFNSIEFKGLS